jgi:hypothetical protein
MYGDVEPKTKGERDGAEQLITKLKLGYLERVSERGGSRRISSGRKRGPSDAGVDVLEEP